MLTQYFEGQPPGKIVKIAPFETFRCSKKEVARTRWSNADRGPQKVGCKPYSFVQYYFMQHNALRLFAHEVSRKSDLYLHLLKASPSLHAAKSEISSHIYSNFIMLLNSITNDFSTFTELPDPSFVTVFEFQIIRMKASWNLLEKPQQQQPVVKAVSKLKPQSLMIERTEVTISYITNLLSNSSWWILIRFWMFVLIIYKTFGHSTLDVCFITYVGRHPRAAGLMMGFSVINYDW